MIHTTVAVPVNEATEIFSTHFELMISIFHGLYGVEDHI